MENFQISENPEASKTMRALEIEIASVKESIEESKNTLTQNIEKIQRLIQDDLKLSKKYSNINKVMEQYTGVDKAAEYATSESFLQNLSMRMENMEKMRDSLLAENNVLESKIKLSETTLRELESRLPANGGLN